MLYKTVTPVWFYNKTVTPGWCYIKYTISLPWSNGMSEWIYNFHTNLEQSLCLYCKISHSVTPSRWCLLNQVRHCIIFQPHVASILTWYDARTKLIEKQHHCWLIITPNTPFCGNILHNHVTSYLVGCNN